MSLPRLPELRTYWAERLGCAASELRRGGATAMGSKDMARRVRVVVYRFMDTTVVLVPPPLTAHFRGRLRHPLSGTNLWALFPELDARPLWTDLVNYLDFARLRHSVDERVRRLASADAASLEALHAACSEQDRTLGHVQLDHPLAVGFVEGGRLLGAASLLFQGDLVSDVGVLTRPGARGQGVGSACVASLCATGRATGRVMQYSTQVSNMASRRLAVRVGFQPFVSEQGWRLSA